MRARLLVVVPLVLAVAACAPDGKRAAPGDAGVARRDAGSAVRDAGSHPADAGGGSEDAGSAPHDAGDGQEPPGEGPEDAGDSQEPPGEGPDDAGEAAPPPTYPFEARATFYSDGPDGSCGFGADPWPYVIAPAEWMNGDGSLCGAFLEITSRHAQHPGAAEGCAKGTTIVAMVTDRCPAQGNEEWCADPSVMHLDLGSDAFAALAHPHCGVVEGLEWRFVERPGDEPIRVVNKDGINPWWYAFFVHRHRYALAKAEVRDASSATWTEALRQPWGAFVLTSASGLVPPLDVRLTDVHGQVLVLDDVVTSLTPEAAFDSDAQFPAGLGGGDPLNLGP